MPVPETELGLALCKRALLDLQFLLIEGFDSNIYDTDIPGVADTCRELIAYIREADPAWEFPS